jgi:hypothetical protein
MLVSSGQRSIRSQAMIDQLDLFHCIKLYFEEKFPELTVGKLDSGENAQIRIYDKNQSLLSIYEDRADRFYYIAHPSPRHQTELGIRGVNDMWNIVQCGFEHPEYFDLLSKAIRIAQTNVEIRNTEGPYDL